MDITKNVFFLPKVFVFLFNSSLKMHATCIEKKMDDACLVPVF